MVDSKKLVNDLIKKYNVEEFCGVSDSTLKSIIDYSIDLGMYIPFTNEGDAVAYAAGRTLSGHNTVVLMQNSGLTNASSAISSLSSLYGIKLIYIVGWRGNPANKAPDEPQHFITGINTTNFIKSISNNYMITYLEYNDDIDSISKNYDNFILVDRGVLSKYESKYSLDTTDHSKYPDRIDLIKYISDIANNNDDVYVLSTTGYTSRELMYFGEVNSKNFYMLGSMGCLISFATGVAHSNPNKKFIVLDGDGSFLMRPEGSYMSDYMCTNNIMHVVFRNGTHLSTGGQILPGYPDEFIYASAPNSYRVTTKSLSSFCSTVDKWLSDDDRCHYVVVAYTSNSVLDSLPRPSQTPNEIAYRFSKRLSEE